jgi:hypothetical protein
VRKRIAISLGVTALFVGPGVGSAWAQFVCPVIPISEAAIEHSGAPNLQPIGDGDYSIIGPTVSVPVGATNQNGTGLPGPGNDRARPGDPDYSPIWNTP